MGPPRKIAAFGEMHNDIGKYESWPLALWMVGIERDTEVCACNIQARMVALNIIVKSSSRASFSIPTCSQLRGRTRRRREVRDRQ